MSGEKNWNDEIKKLNTEDAKMQERMDNTAITLHPKFMLYQALLTGKGEHVNYKAAYKVANAAYKLYLEKNPS